MTAQLASWTEGDTRKTIMDFVAAVTDESGPDYVAPEERIAFFDNDGTLWPEQPIIIQADFIIRRFVEMARNDVSLRAQQPYKAAHENDMAWFGAAVSKHYAGDNADLGVVLKAMAAAFTDYTIDEYASHAEAFFAEATHPTLGIPYRKCGYLPMIELLRYLEANGFTTYIASAGDRDFMRAVAWPLYGVPAERVVGSSVKLDLHETDDGVVVRYGSAMDFFDDGPEKPVRIWSRTGRRPLIAGGNSNGDIEMLRFANVPDRACLRLLVHHDDAEREFAYDKGAEKALDRAANQGWTVISMKNDWSTIFPDPS